MTRTVGHAIFGWITGKSFDEVVETIARMSEASNIHAEIIETKPRVAVFIGEKYFLRTNSTASATVIVVEGKGGQHLVRIITTGAGGGLLNIGYGANKTYAREIAKALEKHLGFKIAQEIDYYKRT